MKKINERVIDWAINRIKTEYKDEVRLLIGADAYRLEKDVGKVVSSFYFPASQKANGMAKTFIIDGIGYDLFPMSWERMERIAELDEDNVPCLLDAKILYSSGEEDKKHFLELQSRLRDNLHNPQYTLKKALEKLNIVMEIYQTMMFEETLYKVRKAAGYIVNFLSSAIAYTNQTYFKNAYVNQISDLSAMKSIPRDFVRLYEAIVKASSSEELKKLCYDMIYNTRQYLSSKKGKGKKGKFNQNFKDLAGWYHELSYAWREVYHWCDQDKAARAFMRGCYLQSELDIVREEFGLSEMDLMGAFNADDMKAYRKRAETLEKQIVSIIKEHGVTLDAYDTIDEFLKKNA
ncbi:MAG TPA: hypothetical protein VGA85_01140 [Dehalococcoidales bacterium]